MFNVNKIIISFIYRKNCFSSKTFDACVEVLDLKEEMPQFRIMARFIGSRPFQDFLTKQ